MAQDQTQPTKETNSGDRTITVKSFTRNNKIIKEYIRTIKHPTNLPPHKQNITINIREYTRKGKIIRAHTKLINKIPKIGTTFTTSQGYEPTPANQPLRTKGTTMNNNILLLDISRDEAKEFVNLESLEKTIKNVDLKIIVENWKITVKGDSTLILHKLNDIKRCLDAAIEEEYADTCEVTRILF